MGQNIFISYRRDDSAMAAGRLYEHLAKHFSRERLFMDVDAMQPGMNFVEELNRQVAKCDVFLAVMGPQWSTIENDDGARRLDDPNDFVRIEIAAALAREIRVIPVLLEGAKMPKAEDLPSNLKPLVERHAVQLRHDRFGADVDLIAKSLGGGPQENPSAHPRRALVAATIFAVALATGLALWYGLPMLAGFDTARQVAVDVPTDASVGDPPASPSKPQVETATVRLEPAPAAQSTPGRIALLIGNSNYQHITSLRTPAKDVALLAASLRHLGFQTTEISDADGKTMRRAILEFAKAIRTYDGSPVGFFYFAGHGVQVQAKNYLLPVDTDATDEIGIELSGIGMDALVETVSGSSQRTNILLFDANHQHPIGGAFRSRSSGLATVLGAENSLIGFSTAPGSISTASDTPLSPYAKALAAAILQSGLTIEGVLKTVRQKVFKATNGGQRPWEVSSLTVNFYPGRK